MADAFRTTYEITFTWHDYRNPTKSLKQADKVYAEAPDSDIWIESDPSGDSDQIRTKSSDELQAFVKQLYQKRNRTVYQVSYCKEKQEGSKQQLKLPDNELLEYGKLLFSDPKQKILKPLPSSRKVTCVHWRDHTDYYVVYGYIRPKNMYTGLSQYQHTISRFGYEILNNNYLRTQGLEQ